MDRRIEILAPAGSYESMRAAMNAGCDAVYIGGNFFGARAYANNLDEETLIRAIDEAHIRDKRLYLTVNTLVKETELQDRLYGYLERLYQEGLDAVIVQDVGVMNFIHRNFPELPIHASTQTTLTMAQGANLLKESGVTRLVTARELSFQEIKDIRKNTDLEIETFVHGALCYCYSGQCLMSSMIGGRSGNRGRCAQPCRMPYQFHSGDSRLSTDQEKYLLSPKDINTIELIPELVEAGIDSFKIEGRMKRPEYAAGVASMYRKYVDLFLQSGKESYQKYLQGKEYEKDMRDLLDLYNRGGFSEGYGKTYHGKKMMSMNRPNHSGILIGEVASLKGGKAGIHLKEDINAQDILEIRNKEGEALYEFTVKDSTPRGSILWTNIGSISSEKHKGRSSHRSIQAENMVYRTKNNQLLDQITEKYISSDKKQGISGILTAKLDQPLKLTLRYHDSTVTAYQDKVQLAMKQPMTKEKLSAPVLKLGDTPYYLEELTVDFDEAVFVPVAWLNEIRRDAIQLLQDAVLQGYKRQLPVLKDSENIRTGHPIINNEDQPETVRGEHLEQTPGFVITIRTQEQFEEAIKYAGINKIYADYHGFSVEEFIRMAKDCGEREIRFYLILPQICRLSTYVMIKKDIALLYGENDITGFVVKNFEEVALMKSFEAEGYKKKDLILNHNMYIFNQEAKLFWKKRGVTQYTAPVELNSRELRSLGLSDCDLLVYGYLPVMVSAQCLYESTSSCKRCKDGKLRIDHLIDRMGMKFYVQTNCKGCYNVIYNGQCLSLLRYTEEVKSLLPANLRLDFTFESGEEVKQVLKAFQIVYRDKGRAELPMENLTAGHFKRGVE